MTDGYWYHGNGKIGGRMSVSEVALIVLLGNFKTKYQRALILQKYVQQYGGLSQEAGIKVREILDEVEE